jgi:hypothetical protein
VTRRRDEYWAEEGFYCSFGITEAIGAVIAGGLTSAGVGAGLAGGIGTGLAGAGLGAAGGATLSAIEGGRPGIGALTGALTGGAAAGLGPAIGAGISDATGIASGTADVIGGVAAGTAAGAGGAALTGGSPLSGALEGGAVGLASGLSSTPASGPTGTTGIAAVSPTAGAAASPGGAASPGAVSVGSGAAGGASGGSAVDLSGSNEFFTPGTSNVLGTAGVTPGISAGGAIDTSSGGIFGDIGSFIGAHPGALISAAPLAIDLLKGNSLPSAGTALEGQAAEAGSMGRTLTAYEQSGTLPAGLRSVVDANTNAGIAKVRSNFAQLGLSGSTMEAQAIESAKQGATAQTVEIANSLAQQGAQYAGLAGSETSNVLRAQLDQQGQFTQALSLFARGLAGGGGFGGSSTAGT